MSGPANGIAGRLAIGARIALVRAGFAIGSARPRRRRVLLATAHADRLEGNLAAIQSELGRRAVAPTVVLARAVRSTLRGRLRAMADHVLAGFHLATATLTVVDDYFFPMYVIRPRSGTARVQTWHAAGAFKKVGYSVLDNRHLNGELTLGLRPEHVVAGSAGGWPLQVELIEMLGAERLVHGQLGSHAFTLRMDGMLPPPAAGSTVQLQLSAQHLHWFDVATGARVE